MSGLISGAKLELVQISRSPTVVSVALQVPQTEAGGIPNGRLTDKFPSNTTFWHILRAFESAKAGGNGVERNFTARGVPKASGGGDTGSGRLYYEMPILHVLGRELSSFTDLQKTLSQLGVNSGTALIRLTFRLVTTPLEEAMAQIEQYFKVEEADSMTGVVAETPTENATSLDSIQSPLTDIKEEPQPSAGMQSSEAMTTGDVSEPVSTTILSPTTIIAGRAVTIFAPPNSTTPQAARQPHRESDYEPTIAHAKLHQSRLNSTTHNKRIPTHAEEAAQKEEQANKLAQVTSVEVKLRFPDQTQVVGKFSNEDTATTLYAFTRTFMESESESFVLTYSSGKGPKVVPRDGKEKLIGQLGMTGKLLVIFSWDEKASPQARLGRIVKLEHSQQAKPLEVAEPEGVDAQEGDYAKPTLGKDQEPKKVKGSGGVPGWLKLGKKK